MDTVRNILSALFQWAPASLAWEKDNIGLILGSHDAQVERILVTVDITNEVVEEAMGLKCDLIVSHHPVIFTAQKSILTNTRQGKIVSTLLKHDIGVIAMHTNADAARYGINYALATKLGLEEIVPLGSINSIHRKSVIYYRQSAVAHDRLREFFDRYESVNWHTSDRGNGIHGIEIELPVWIEKDALSDLRSLLSDGLVSSYTMEIENSSDKYGIGAIGLLAKPVQARSFLLEMKNLLDCASIRTTDFSEEKVIRRVAACGGAGGNLIQTAITACADLYVTSDLTYHHFHDVHDNMILVDAGHYETEKVFIGQCISVLEDALFKTKKKIDILPSRTDTNPMRFL